MRKHFGKIISIVYRLSNRIQILPIIIIMYIEVGISVNHGVQQNHHHHHHLKDRMIQMIRLKRWAKLNSFPIHFKIPIYPLMMYVKICINLASIPIIMMVFNEFFSLPMFFLFIFFFCFVFFFFFFRSFIHQIYSTLPFYRH